MDRHRPSVVFVDLDSTLADTRPRWHLIEDDYDKTDWVKYALACADDIPITGTAALVRMLFQFHRIVILSGRAAAASKLTREWLSNHVIPYDMIVLREEGPDFYTPNGEWKSKQIAKWKYEHPQDVLSLVIDDWPEAKEVIERDHGIPVLMVNPMYRLEEYAPEAEKVENREGVSWARTLR
jgi:hypothetical protein